jgi:hypothetical protein
MAEVIGTVSACISILVFAAQITRKIESLKELSEFTPAEIAQELQHLSDRLESFRAHILLLQPLENHPTIKPAVELSAKRFLVIEKVLQKLQRKLLPKGNAPSRGRRVKVLFSHQYVEEQIKKIEDNINGLSHEIQR